MESSMDTAARVRLLQAVEHVLTQKRPDRSDIQKLMDYAHAEMQNSSGLDLDELATVIALKVMNIESDRRI